MKAENKDTAEINSMEFFLPLAISCSISFVCSQDRQPHCWGNDIFGDKITTKLLPNHFRASAWCSICLFLLPTCANVVARDVSEKTKQDIKTNFFHGCEEKCCCAYDTQWHHCVIISNSIPIKPLESSDVSANLSLPELLNTAFFSASRIDEGSRI